jgi:hypothetical protein
VSAMTDLEVQVPTWLQFDGRVSDVRLSEAHRNSLTHAETTDQNTQEDRNDGTGVRTILVDLRRDSMS